MVGENIIDTDGEDDLEQLPAPDDDDDTLPLGFEEEDDLDRRRDPLRDPLRTP
jgi:hypothetical protein